MALNLDKNAQDLERNMHGLAKKAWHGQQLLTQGQAGRTLLVMGKRKWKR